MRLYPRLLCDDKEMIFDSVGRKSSFLLMNEIRLCFLLSGYQILKPIHDNIAAAAGNVEVDTSLHECGWSVQVSIYPF